MGWASDGIICVGGNAQILSLPVGVAWEITSRLLRSLFGREREGPNIVWVLSKIFYFHHDPAHKAMEDWLDLDDFILLGSNLLLRTSWSSDRSTNLLVREKMGR